VGGLCRAGDFVAWSKGGKKQHPRIHVLIDFQRNLILLTPPKCGTVTLHQELPRFGATPTFGQQFDGGNGEHTIHLPGDAWAAIERFRIAVVVRNPYTRATSLYGHYRRYWQAPYLPFPEFLARIVAAPRHLFFNATISSMLSPLEHPLDGRRPLPVTHHVRLECLADDLKRLGYPIATALPRAHALPHESLAAYTPQARDLVALWGLHDFERFGYRLDLAAAEEPGRDGIGGTAASRG